MRSLAVRLLLSLSSLLLVPIAVGHDVTLTGTSSFTSLDGSSSDHDGIANGVFTVSDGNLIVNGHVLCTDAQSGNNSGCNMAFAVSGNMTVNAGASLQSDNLQGSGNGGNITLTVGGHFTLQGATTGPYAPGALVSTGSVSSSSGDGGSVSANVSGSVNLGPFSVISAASKGRNSGAISIVAGGPVVLNGVVASGTSRIVEVLTMWTGRIFEDGNGQQRGGAITIRSTGFAEPAITVGHTAVVASQGKLSSGAVRLDGCGVIVRGLVASVSASGASQVAIRSGKGMAIESQDVGVSTFTPTRLARVRADSLSGDAVANKVDLFANEAIQISGVTSSLQLHTISSNPGDSSSTGGRVTVISLNSTVTAGGRSIQAGIDEDRNKGGRIDISAKGNVGLDTASIRAIGDYSELKNGHKGGQINVRSHSGNISWVNGVGDVRPTGSQVSAANRGTIALSACGTVTTSGSQFPTNGPAVGPYPTIQSSCAPAAPSLPAGEPVLAICNTPPVANDTAASTNEDTTVTVNLSGSDADGDPLTFTIVSGPSNGSLGPIVPTGPTTATVNYTPNLNYNGGDSFVYRANDGNGGTDDATATITVGAVNDPPSFLAGPTVVRLEDAGPQTVANWVTSISPGPADESSQTVTFTVTNDNNALFSVQPSVAPNGTLTFTPAANAYGTATLTITAQDNGGTANGGNDTSAAQTSNINITPLNDEPSFTAGANQSVNEDAGAQSVSGWATGISAGPNESSQTVAFNVSNNNNALFSTQPAVSPSGTLTYTPAANANGTATVSVFVQDDGGTVNGGDDTSATQTFTITVNAVNDEPSFTSGGNVSVLEDSGAYSAAWATGISAGPADESGQTVSFSASNNNNALFASQPSIAANGTLTFTPAANAFGTATVTVTLSDNGGAANGGDDTSPAQTFTITVDAVNDEPSFTGGGNITVLEDAAPYSAAWVSASSAGPGESQNLTYFASNNNNALFSVQPSVANDGTLSFTVAPNANGTATLSVYVMDDGGTANGGDDTSATQTFTIEVTAVNDTPSFTGGGNVTVNEDSGAYSATWATAISAGPADEAGQNLTFTVTGNSNPALFAIPPSIASDGTLSFTLAADLFGTSTITVTLSDDGGGANTSAPQSFDIIVNNVNDEPTFSPGGDVAVNEDSGAYSATWATSISAGANEAGQTLTFVVANDNNALFAVQPAISASGVLTFTPAANAFGAAIVTVYLQDNGGTANGGDDTSATVQFQIEVHSVNDQPAFVSGGDVTVNEDSGTYSAPWATSVSAGPANEGGQSLTFTITGNSNAALFASGPSVAPDGSLTFTPASNAFGTASITAVLQDNGGTANGGVDTSTAVTFNINVSSVNDPPSFTAGGNVSVNEDSGIYLASWATAISAGPGESQPLTFTVTNDNNALFSAQPAINPSGVLTFTPAANAFGTANVTVTLSDGIDSTAPVTFVITVSGVNDPPTANNDSWETEGNTELRVDVGAGVTPNVSDTTGSGRGVADNDADGVEGDPFTVTGIVGCGDTVAPYVCAVTGGTVTMNANGSFSFQPAAGATSGSFQYTVTDQPVAGTPASATASVTITIHDMIWYVNGAAAPGNGTSAAPFSTFAALNGVGDIDSFGHYIFVHTSAVSGGIEMEGGQRLWGQGVGLIIPRNLNGNGSPTTIVAPGVKPTITAATGNAVTVTSVSGVEVAGLSLAAPAGNGIEVNSVPLGPTVGALIYSNAITAGAEGIDVNIDAALGGSVGIDTTSIISAGNGVDLLATDGNTVFSFTNGTVLSTAGSGIVADGSAADMLIVNGLTNVTIDGNTTGDGIVITASRFDANPGTAPIDTLNTGTITVGSSGNPVGGQGVVLTNATGSLAFGTLNVAASTNGVRITGGSGGLIVTSGGGAITANAGVGLSVSNATIGATNLTFTSISAAGAANGILLDNTGTLGGLKVLGTGTAGSGGTIQNTTADGISVRATIGLSLSWMSVQNTAHNGIRGTQVVNFAFANGSVSATGTAAAGPAREGGIVFNESLSFTENNVSGVVSITNSSIANARRNALEITNWSGTISSLTISNNTLTSTTSTATSLGHAVLVQTQGTASATANLTRADILNNQISNFPSGSGIFVAGGNPGAPTLFTLGIPNTVDAITISGNRIAGASSLQRMGGNAIAVAANGCNGRANFVITGNGTVTQPLTNFAGLGISHFIGGSINATALIDGNVIVANNTAGSAGIATQVDQACGVSDAALSAVTISNNIVSGTEGNGIRGIARASNGTLSLEVTGNSVTAPTLANRQGIRVDSGSAAGDVSLCLEITNNTSAGSGVSKGIGLRKQGTNPAINSFGVVGMVATSTPGVENYVDSQNPAGGGSELISATSGFSNCTL